MDRQINKEQTMRDCKKREKNLFTFNIFNMCVLYSLIDSATVKDLINRYY